MYYQEFNNVLSAIYFEKKQEDGQEAKKKPRNCIEYVTVNELKRSTIS